MLSELIPSADPLRESSSKRARARFSGDKLPCYLIGDVCGHRKAVAARYGRSFLFCSLFPGHAVLFASDGLDS